MIFWLFFECCCGISIFFVSNAAVAFAERISSEVECRENCFHQRQKGNGGHFVFPSGLESLFAIFVFRRKMIERIQHQRANHVCNPGQQVLVCQIITPGGA